MKKIKAKVKHQPSINVYGSDDWNYRPKQVSSSEVMGNKPKGWNFKRSDYTVRLFLVFDVWKSNTLIETRVYRDEYVIRDVAFNGRNYKPSDTLEGKFIETIPDHQEKLQRKAERDLKDDFPSDEGYYIVYNNKASSKTIERMG